MKKVNMETAIKRYNGIMTQICWDHRTIGTKSSEGTEGWNLRDMVSEVQYVLDFWNDPDSVHWMDAHDEDQPITNGRKEWFCRWQSDTGKMKRFITTYSPFIKDMECTQGHCSIYD